MDLGTQDRVRTERPAPVIGLTGGIACGKSVVGRLLEKRGAAVLDTDAVAHELMRKGAPLYRRMVRRFGREIVAAGGEIDRRALGGRVFASARERRALEALAHPPVRTVVRRWLKAQARAGRPAVVLVPLLFEIGWMDPWDVVVCVTARRRTALARLRGRGWSAAEARARLAAQWPVAEKARRADLVIRNNGSLDELKQKVRALWKTINQEER